MIEGSGDSAPDEAVGESNALSGCAPLRRQRCVRT
jgi:hypothetical protein